MRSRFSSPSRQQQSAVLEGKCIAPGAPSCCFDGHAPPVLRFTSHQQRYVSSNTAASPPRFGVCLVYYTKQPRIDQMPPLRTLSLSLYAPQFVGWGTSDAHHRCTSSCRLEGRAFPLEANGCWLAVQAGKSTKYMSFAKQIRERADLWPALPDTATLQGQMGQLIGAIRVTISRQRGDPAVATNPWATLPEPLPYCWAIADVVALPEPVKHAGQLRVWWVEPEPSKIIVDAIDAYLKAKTQTYLAVMPSKQVYPQAPAVGPSAGTKRRLEDGPESSEGEGASSSSGHPSKLHKAEAADAGVLLGLSGADVGWADSAGPSAASSSSSSSHYPLHVSASHPYLGHHGHHSHTHTHQSHGMHGHVSGASGHAQGHPSYGGYASSYQGPIAMDGRSVSTTRTASTNNSNSSHSTSHSSSNSGSRGSGSGSGSSSAGGAFTHVGHSGLGHHAGGTGMHMSHHNPGQGVYDSPGQTLARALQTETSS